MSTALAFGLTVAALVLTSCQSINCYDNATCSTISQERGGNSPSTLNPPITATVRDPNVQVNSATGDQVRQ